MRQDGRASMTGSGRCDPAARLQFRRRKGIAERSASLAMTRKYGRFLEVSDWMERVKRRSTRARVKAVRGCTTRPPGHIVFTLFGRPVEKVLDRGFYHQ